MIRTQADLDTAIARGATEIELQAVEPLRLTNVSRPVKLVGEMRPLALAGPEANVLTLDRCIGVNIAGASLFGVADGPGFRGRGIYAVECRDIDVSAAAFANLYRAAVYERVAGFAFSRCDVEPVQAEGFNFAACSDGELVENAFSDFRPQMQPDGSGDHPDAIQMWTLGQKAGCSNIAIKRNLIVGNTKEPPQGIWLTSQDELRHSRLSVVGNLLINILWNGLCVCQTDDAAILHNTLMWQEGVFAKGGDGRPDQIGIAPRIRLDGTNGAVSGNVAAAYGREGSPWNWVPPGNEVGKPSTVAEIAAAISAWKATYRPSSAAAPAPPPSPPPLPTPSTLVAAQKARKEMNDIKNGAARAVYAIDRLISELRARG